MTLPIVDSCSEADYLDRTAAGADRTLDWDFAFAGSPERCLTIRAGQSVTWMGNFEMHPLQSDQGDVPNPVSSYDPSGVVTFAQPGLFGFRCNYHFEMRGSIQVLAAPPATPVPWHGALGPLSLAVLLLVCGLWVRQRRVLVPTRRRRDP